MGSYCTKKIVKYEETVKFIPPVTKGQVVKVYDGDTIHIATTLPLKGKEKVMYRFVVRLAGIDTPELKGSSDKEKKKAIKARDYLSELIMNKHVTLKDVKTEKYGRLLADVYVGKVWVNQRLLETKHAQPYDGGKKPSW